MSIFDQIKRIEDECIAFMLAQAHGKIGRDDMVAQRAFQDLIAHLIDPAVLLELTKAWRKANDPRLVH